MDLKSKILTYTLISLVILSVSASYYRFIILKDYVIEAEVDCDVESESCFVWNCEAGVDCTGNPDEDTWYYKIAHRNAKNIPSCDSTSEDCDLYTCTPDEADCATIYCDSATDTCSSKPTLPDETSDITTSQETTTDSESDVSYTDSTMSSDIQTDGE